MRRAGEIGLLLTGLVALYLAWRIIDQALSFREMTTAAALGTGLCFAVAVGAFWLVGAGKLHR